MATTILDIYNRISQELRGISSGLVQVSKLTNTPFLSKLSGTTNTSVKNILIYVQKDQANSIDQIEWIKKAKYCFPETCVTACIVRKIKGTIPSLRELKDHKKYSQPVGQGRLTDNEFYNIIQHNVNVDVVHFIDHHLDIDNVLYDFVMLTKNDMTQIFNHYKNYVYNYNDLKDSPWKMDPTGSSLQPLFPNYAKKNFDYPRIQKILHNSKNDINFLTHTTPNILTYTTNTDLNGNQIILDAEGNKINTDLIDRPLYSTISIPQIIESIGKILVDVDKLNKEFSKRRDGRNNDFPEALESLTVLVYAIASQYAEISAMANNDSDAIYWIFAEAGILFAALSSNTASFVESKKGKATIQTIEDLYKVIGPILDRIVESISTIKQSLEANQLTSYLPTYYEDRFPSINRDRWAIWCDSVFIVPKYTPVRKDIVLFETMSFTGKVGYIAEKYIDSIN